MSAKTNVQQRINTKIYMNFRAALSEAGKNGGALSIAEGIEKAMILLTEKEEKEQRDGKK